MKYAIEPLQKEGIRIVFYLDDICLLAKSKKRNVQCYPKSADSFGIIGLSNKSRQEYTRAVEETGILGFRVQQQNHGDSRPELEDSELIEENSSTGDSTETVMSMDC
ncbi:hypothetical protein G6F56_003569 [Rhizopus delemar]|nr:hypothetical protein G6F56_003569 [Rhizopus delemar]